MNQPAVFGGSGKHSGPSIKVPVEVVDGALFTTPEVRDAVAIAAVTSGLCCAAIGFGFGYFLALQKRGDRCNSR